MLKQLNTPELSQILKTCPMGLVITDDKQTIVWVNDTFQDYLGICADEIISLNLSALPDILKPLFTSSNTVHIPANSIRDDQWYKCSQQQLDDNKYTAHFMNDIGQLHLLMKSHAVLKDELREALAVDEVTGMPNKVALFKSLESQISRSRRYNNLLSIIIVQINHLDQLDETQTADLLLPISQMLNDQVRWADIAGKLSDNQFLLVLPETTEEACKNLSNNLNERLQELPVPQGLPENFKVSANFGYSEWSKGDDLTLLMQKARAQLD